MFARQRKMDGIGDEDRLSSLPDSLLWQILLNLSTKDSIKTSVLSSRWGNLWRYVPGMDLDHDDLPDFNDFASFVDRFLGVNSESSLRRFKIQYYWDWDEDEPDIEGSDKNRAYNNSLVTRWISTVAERRVQHLEVLDENYRWPKVLIPATVCTCESLVSLKLCDVILPSPESVTLPSLEVIYFDMVVFADDSAFERLISGCPVLKRLTSSRCCFDNVTVLRVCSNSLLSLTYLEYSVFLISDLVVAIDAPRLDYLKLCDLNTSFIIHNLESIVKVDIDIAFDFGLINGKMFDWNDINRIRNFLVGVSIVKDMVISLCTLKIVYNYSRHQPLPLFPNLSSMSVSDGAWTPATDFEWQMLPVFLERCPSLRSLVLGSTRYLEKGGFSSLSERPCFLSSLEYVEIESPFKGSAMDMKVVSYFLENSTILKKLTLRFDVSGKKEEESVILRKLHTIPRLSTSCQVVVLSDPHSHRL